MTIGVATGSILQKEAIAKSGVAVMVELQPVDPRSLMQGDYMRLSFNVGHLSTEMLDGASRSLIGRIGQDGTWKASRADDGTSLARDEIRINLSGTPTHPIFVSDAWFFKEGEALRWAGARYGELRVRPDGSAILVRLRGKNFEAL